jgi:hypothetical protein
MYIAATGEPRAVENFIERSIAQKLRAACAQAPVRV